MEELMLRMERAHEAMLRRHERGEDVSAVGRNFTRKLKDLDLLEKLKGEAE